MLGDTLREAAVLFLVFIPLDIARGVAERQLSLTQSQIIFIVVGTVVGSAFLEWLGMVLEGRR